MFKALLMLGEAFMVTAIDMMRLANDLSVGVVDEDYVQQEFARLSAEHERDVNDITAVLHGK